MPAQKDSEKQRSLGEIIRESVVFFLILIVVAPLLLVVGLFFGTRVLVSLWYGLLVRIRWIPEKRYILFVSSHDFRFKEYLETHILKGLDPYIEMLDWSRRHQWDLKKKPLALNMFLHWNSIKEKAIARGSGRRGFPCLPFAIIFHPWWHPKVFRFQRAFRVYARGDTEPLESIKREWVMAINTLPYH